MALLLLVLLTLQELDCPHILLLVLQKNEFIGGTGITGITGSTGVTMLGSTTGFTGSKFSFVFVSKLIGATGSGFTGISTGVGTLVSLNVSFASNFCVSSNFLFFWSFLPKNKND